MLSFLALQDEGAAHRVVAAERLWPDIPPRRANANLRSALWRGRQVDGATIIDCIGPRLRLSPSSHVDLVLLLNRTRRALCAPDVFCAEEFQKLADALRRELLPDNPDEWLVLERERWDQVRLHMLEDLARRLFAEKLYLPALQTALTAIEIEPIRDTAHRIIIEVHLAEGNAASALRHYRRYRALLNRELGVAPSPRITELMDDLMPS